MAKTHILLIDPLEKLNVQKDSSLMLALSLQQSGPTFVMFPEDLGFRSEGEGQFQVFEFSGAFSDEGFYLDNFQLGHPQRITLDESCTIHMRLDPPVDAHYIRVLWLLKAWEDLGVQVLNSAAGILKHNEKMAAYVLPSTLPTYVGGNLKDCQEFAQSLPTEELIFKPLDLYQGMGVKKVHRDQIANVFEKTRDESGGTVVVQPFYSGIKDGEIRTVWFNGEELGTILKVPPEGSYLANIAQGAKYHKVELSSKVHRSCKDVSEQLAQEGIYWLAIDVLGEHLSEVNLTCPGLLVEVSTAMEVNLAQSIGQKVTQLR